MTGESEEKKMNSYKSSENVPLAEHEILKGAYENLMREHEILIKTLELLEKTHGFTVEDLEKKQREAMVAKEVIEKWENKFGEMQKKLETLEKDIEDLKSIDETEMNGMDSDNAENLNVKSNIVSDKDVIDISDEDEGNQRESDRGHINSPHSNSEFAFIL